MNKYKHWGHPRIHCFLLLLSFILLSFVALGAEPGPPTCGHWTMASSQLFPAATLAPCLRWVWTGAMINVSVNRPQRSLLFCVSVFKKKDERPLFSQMRHTEQCLLQFRGKRRHSHWRFSHVSPKGALNLERLHHVSQRSGDRERWVSSSDTLHSTRHPGPCRSFRRSCSGSPMWSPSCGSPKALAYGLCSKTMSTPTEAVTLFNSCNSFRAMERCWNVSINKEENGNAIKES